MLWYIHEFTFFLEGNRGSSHSCGLGFPMARETLMHNAHSHLAGSLWVSKMFLASTNHLSKYISLRAAPQQQNCPVQPLRTDNILKWGCCNEISVSDYWRRGNNGGWIGREKNCPLGIWKTKASFFFKILTLSCCIFKCKLISKKKKNPSIRLVRNSGEISQSHSHDMFWWITSKPSIWNVSMKHIWFREHDLGLNTFARFPFCLALNLIYLFYVKFSWKGKVGLYPNLCPKTSSLYEYFMPVKSGALPAKYIQENWMLE